MDQEALFSLIRREILTSPAYQGVLTFPEHIERMRRVEELVWWLGTTDFSSTQAGEYAATAELACIHYRCDPSHAALMRLLSFLLNLDTPGFLESGGASLSQHVGDRDREVLTIHSISEAIRKAVRQRPSMRLALAQYIIFENLGVYDSMTLAELAASVETAYQIEFGDRAFASSTRDVAHALAGTSLTEREQVRAMLALALQIGTGHIRSRLAINWIAQVHLRDPDVQQELDRLKQMTMKQIWQQQMVYSTKDPEFLTVLLRGEMLDNNQN